MTDKNYTVNTTANQEPSNEQIVTELAEKAIIRDRVLKRLELNASDKEISESTGCPLELVPELKKTILTEWYISSFSKNGKLSKEDRIRMNWMSREGISERLTARTIGCSIDTVRFVLRNNYIGYTRKNPDSEFTGEDIEALRALYFLNKGIDEIALQLESDPEKIGSLTEKMIISYASDHQNGEDLHWDDLFFIQEALKLDFSQLKISRQVGCAQSTLSRLINDGECQKDTNFDAGKAFFVRRNRRHRKKDRYKQEKTEKFLKLLAEAVNSKTDSIYSFAARVRDDPEAFGLTDEELLCFKTLYTYVHKGIIPLKCQSYAEKSEDLPTKAAEPSENRRPVGKSIDEMPQKPKKDGKVVFGHFEMDTVRGTRTSRKNLFTLIEKNSHFGIVHLLDSKSKDEVTLFLQSLTKEMTDIWETSIKSVLTDNGTEFADCSKIEEIAEILYCAHPAEPTEKPQIERYNRTLRLFFPKGESMDWADQSDALEAGKKLALKPVRSLHGCSPWEVFCHEVRENLKDSPEIAEEFLDFFRHYYHIEETMFQEPEMSDI